MWINFLRNIVTSSARLLSTGGLHELQWEPRAVIANVLPPMRFSVTALASLDSDFVLMLLVDEPPRQRPLNQSLLLRFVFGLLALFVFLVAKPDSGDFGMVGVPNLLRDSLPRLSM